MAKRGNVIPVVTKDGLVSVLQAPGVLEGPYAEITIGDRHLEIYVKPGRKYRIDAKSHGIKLREAAEQWTPAHPNPCLVALDEADEFGGPYVWGRITVGSAHA